MFEKECRPKGGDPSKYPHYEYDTSKYYNKVPIPVTDEEYEQILKHTETPKRDGAAGALSFIGVLIYIIGFIVGCFFVKNSFTTALSYWVDAFVSGTMMLGFAEIIKLLHKINSK